MSFAALSRAVGSEGSELPIYAPADKDGTLLLKPAQDPIAVFGEAWAKLRYGEHVLTGYRQLIDVGYVNPQDNRMVPNTFEAAMLDGKVGWLGSWLNWSRPRAFVWT